MKLYTFWRSSAAYRVRIALNLKGLQYQSCTTRLPAHEQQSAAYRALNPQALVPTLVDGATVLGQSLAIIEYLDETCQSHPCCPRILPRGRRCGRWLSQSPATSIRSTTCGC